VPVVREKRRILFKYLRAQEKSVVPSIQSDSGRQEVGVTLSRIERPVCKTCPRRSREKAVRMRRRRHVTVIPSVADVAVGVRAPR
jgi:transposase-like protein